MKKITFIMLSILLNSSVFSQSGWQVLTTNYSHNLNDVLAVNDTDIVCVGGNYAHGDLIYSLNGGNLWNTTAVTSSALNAVSVTTSGIWVAGDSGKVYYSNNGFTWLAQNTGTTANLKAIDFPLSTTGYAVGSSGTILKTTDGQTWSNPVVSGSVTYEINAVKFATDSIGVFGGNKNGLQGFVMLTTSAAAYYSQPYTTLSIVNDIDYLSANVAFSVGKGGSIYKTTNGGSSWSMVSSGVTNDLMAIDFYDSNYGYIVGASGTILKTIDGGTNWVAQNSPTTNDLYGVSCLDSNTVFAVGQNGTIIRTTSGGAYLSVHVNDDTVYCNGYTNLIAHTSYSGSGSLSYMWSPSPYLSTTTDSLTTAGPLQSNQTFYVTVTDGNLSASDSATVHIGILPADSICLVTVDDSIGHNLVVFEKHIQGPIERYNIYSETNVTGVYDSIGFIPADSAGVFVDVGSNPVVKAYSYKISSVDSCGNETLLSAHHKTMHLSINQGAGASWNLIWNFYEGIPVQTYRIWRADTSLNWVNVGSVAGSNNSWTDLNPPPGDVYYQVEIVSPYICRPYNYKTNTNYNYSRSNRANSGLIPASISADFGATTTSGAIPLVVQFNNQSSGNPDNYFWDFGDGDTSHIASPSHTYIAVGRYTVKLVAYKANEADSITKVDFIDALPNGFKENNKLYSINIYPNPIKQNHSLYIKHKDITIDKVEVIDLLGKLIPFQLNDSPLLSEVKFNAIAKGIYFIRISDKWGNHIQRKFIIR